ncbi:hypothetical protein O181_054367 [Austropuccinia psidii MF-1]|uniref:Uncharacterized protein n=1 Tax=Austropuccinia psidii MF-1 TaxID=1389203 RepID=A0A9Q3EBK6_9BASI|nr:hypothetical protein [Austropuccinia psidii MF-1]
MSSTERLQQKMLEMQEELLALIKKEGKINHQVILHKIVHLKNKPSFQGHSGHMEPRHLTQDPWPHQHLTPNKDKILYREE